MSDTSCASCVICGDPLEGSAVVGLPCTPTRQHQFHLRCIVGWFCALRARNSTATCPICRAAEHDKDTLPEMSWKAHGRRIKHTQPEPETKPMTSDELGAWRLQLCEHGAEHTAVELTQPEQELLAAFELAVAVVRKVVRRVLARKTLPPTLQLRAMIGVMRPNTQDADDSDEEEVDENEEEEETETEEDDVYRASKSIEHAFNLPRESETARSVHALVDSFVSRGRKEIAPWQRYGEGFGSVERELKAHRNALAIATPVAGDVRANTTEDTENKVMLFALNLSHSSIQGQCARTLKGLSMIAEAATEACIVYELPAFTLSKRERARMYVLLLKTAVGVLRHTFGLAPLSAPLAPLAATSATSDAAVVGLIVASVDGGSSTSTNTSMNIGKQMQSEQEGVDRAVGAVPLAVSCVDETTQIAGHKRSRNL